MSRLLSFCSTTGQNTGGIDCDVRWGAPRMGFIGGAKILPSEYATEATLKAALLDRINRPNGDSEKLYPFPLINAVTPNSEAPQDETLQDGSKRRLRSEIPAYLLESANVGLNQEAAMMAFNGTIIPMFMLDNTGKFGGKLDSSLNFIGSKVNISTSAAGYSPYNAGTTTKTQVSYVDPAALSGNAALFETTSFDTDDFEGLLDVTLTKVSSASNAHTIKAIIKNRSLNKDVNLATKYSTAMADVDMWYGVTSAGAIVAPSTVTYSSGSQNWVVTFSVAVAKVNIATPDVLFTNDVTGIEGVAVAVV
jgi:hypothetical protein